VKKLANHWENEVKSHVAALESSREGNRKILSDIETYETREATKRSDIDTLNSTIADIRRERELLQSDYDSLKEELDDNESKLNEVREQRENFQGELTNKAAFEAEIVRHKAQEVTLRHTADQLQRELSGVRQDLTTATTTIDELTQQLRAAK